MNIKAVIFDLDGTIANTLPLCIRAFIVLILLVVFNSIPSFAQKEYNVVKEGAVGDGQTLNTKAIQRAIDKASRSGGGKVIIPEGRFLTGTLEMKSNVELYLEKNALLLGSTNPAHYRSLDTKGLPESPKKDDNSQLALLTAVKANNISITGKGTVDGQGLALALAIDSLHHSGIVVDPNYSSYAGRPNEKMRPKLIRFSGCDNVRFSEATFKNSSCWGLSIDLCNHLLLDGITVSNRAYWNNDGMDITDCKNVRITNCTISAADDGICLKSYFPGYADDSIYIAHCTVRSGASALKFGTASYGGFKNITIEDVKVFDTYRSAIAIESVDGGTIENINIRNIIAKNTGNALFIRLGNRYGNTPGIVKNIHISNVNVQIPFVRPDINDDLRADESSYHNNYPGSITGIPGAYVQDVVLENIEITYPGKASKGQAYFGLYRLKEFPEKIKDYPEYSMFGEMPAWGFYVRHAKGISMKNVTLKLSEPDFRPALIFDDVKGVTLDRVQLPAERSEDQIILKDVSDFKQSPAEKKLVRSIE